MRSRPARGAVAAYAAAALLVVLAAVMLVRSAAAPHDPPVASSTQAEAALDPSESPTTSPRPPSTRTGSSAVVGAHPATPGADPALPPPVAFRVPSAGIAMPVEPTGVGPDGQMRIPPNIRRIGWYEYGPSPQSDTGAVVLAGHVDSEEQGTGPLARLRDLSTGDTVRIALDDGSTVSYRVTTVVRIPKDELDLEAVFDRAGPARLHVLTCGGAFDESTGHYEDNILVTADPVG